MHLITQYKPKNKQKLLTAQQKLEVHTSIQARKQRESITMQNL